MDEPVLNTDKLIVLGMGSPSDAKAFEKTQLDGKSIDEFLASQSVHAFRHPKSGKYLVTSIHRTTGDTVDYAYQLNEMIMDDSNIVGVFYGGLAFALPGVFAAQAFAMPVVAVPGDEDAFYNVYKIPDGTPVGVTEIGNIGKGVRLATKILNADYHAPINVVFKGNCPSIDTVKSFFEKTEPAVNYVQDNGQHFTGLTVCLAENMSYLIDLDERVELGVFGVEKTIRSAEVYPHLTDLKNSLILGRPGNLPLYAARIRGLNDPIVKQSLEFFREEEAEKYDSHIEITRADFK